MTPTSGLQAGYEAALQRAAFIQLADPGYLRIQGPDRQNFLQRQSTNDLDRLSTGKVLVTVLTSPTARILDMLTLFDEDADTFAALTLAGQSGRTFQYLKSRIFFMDKVSVEDASQQYAHFELAGPRVGAVLQRLGLERVPSEGEQSRWQLENSRMRILRAAEPGFRLLAAVEHAGQVQSALEWAGAEPLSEESRMILRLEAGIPAVGAELTEDYTPLETGLGWAVSDSKGCYTGQEVIARQLTYDKVTQRLVGLWLSAPANPGLRLLTPDDGRLAGKVTSAAISPRFGPIALAVVRRPNDAPGVRLAVGEGQESAQAVVTSLPFTPPEPSNP